MAIKSVPPVEAPPINAILQLSEQGIQVLSMRNKANRLEELFVSLVNEKQGDRA